MLSCPTNLSFSNAYASRRLQCAYQILGTSIVHRIIGFALFLMGANREHIASYLGMPFGTFLSFLTRIEKHGLTALEDQRKRSAVQQSKVETPFRLSLRVGEKHIDISLDRKHSSIIIPQSNVLQSKVVLLTLQKSGLLSGKEVSGALGLSERHTRELSARLHTQDTPALIDQRKGQLKEYRFTPEVKAELVQQFAANVICGQNTSSRFLAAQLDKRCEMHLSDRTIRFHLQKMGLSRITKSLPKLVAALKKTPPNTEELEKGA